MVILFDINHPAHVHYFRNSIIQLKKDGHQVIVVSRNKEMEYQLLKKYNIPFIKRGAGSNTLTGRIFYHFISVLRIIFIIVRYKVDVIVSFMHPYAVQAAFLTAKKSILFSDTESANLHHKFSVPFADEIHTSENFKLDLGAKQRRFKGIMECSYLSDKYFQPDIGIFEQLELSGNERFIFFRFTSRNSLHDRGRRGITDAQKIKIINTYSDNYKILISSEIPLPERLKKYKVNIAVDKIHSVLYYASLFIGESPTMASESALLGTPAIYFDNDGRGYTDWLSNEFDIVTRFDEDQEGIEKGIIKANEILEIDDNIKYRNVRKRIFDKCEDVTQYILNQIT